MQIKQNGSWVMPPEGVQWKQDGVWMQGAINWVQLGDVDFNKTPDGRRFRYIGTYPYVILPDVIEGVSVNNYGEMFYKTSVRGVKSTNKNVTSMVSMFHSTQATSLDLSNFDTSNVTNMYQMFFGSSVTSLDLSNFDTSNVTNMNYMFLGAKATTGYARTQADADKFNASSGKPEGLNFVVKP